MTPDTVFRYSHVAGVSLQFTKFSYPLFEEQQAWTFDSISSTIGNVIGFYLGLDMLMIIQFLFDKAFALTVVIIRCWIRSRTERTREA